MRSTPAMVAAALASSWVLLSGASTVQVEPPMAIPSAWKATGPAARGDLVELLFAVKQQGLQELHDALMRVSSPSSPEFGQHLTNEEVQRMTAPAPEDIEAVSAFLRQHGAEPRAATPNSDMIAATVPVEVAERMLGARYVDLVHTSGTVVTRIVDGYSLPAAVAAAVDLVAPTTHIPGVHRPIVRVNQSNGWGINSPKNLRTLYNVGTAEGKASTNKQAVTGFLEQMYQAASLKAFWAMFCGGIQCGKGMPKLVGDKTTGYPKAESMLDIETITGVAGNVESEFWGFAGRSEDNPKNEPFLKWLQQLSSTGDADVPKIFSTSYGEDENSWSHAAAQRLNVEFQKAGVRGISLLFASGDQGANCKNGKFLPEGPASSPYVTTVGGTEPHGSWPKPGGEVAAGLSSGGFSNYWPMPDWQKDAVSQYLKQGGVPNSTFGYNTSGRAFPDLAAQASNFLVIAGIPIGGVAGTSCASPTAAGIFSLLNDLRLQNGKSTLGFLNPFIYQHASAFNDITTGSSDGCDLFGQGWPATPGWDAVTGVGTPDYAKLAQAALSLPSGRVLGEPVAVVV